MGKATSQIRDTLKFLAEHEEISIVNERGHAFTIRGADLGEIAKIVVYLGGRALPDECWRTFFHVSQTAGFIHIVAAHDYLGVLEKLRVPEDIRRYFAYRQEVTPKLQEAGVVVDEPDILGGFLTGETLPTPQSRRALQKLVQDLAEFDMSGVIGNLHNHIQNSQDPRDYYKIMHEFARVPRSVWREVKLRFVKALQTVERREWTRPFRLSVPATDCTFVICPLDPQVGADGPDGVEMRIAGVKNFTYAAMYEAHTSKGIGILISKDGEYVQIEWALLDIPWQHDPEMEARLAGHNPFRPTEERNIAGFLFATEV